jgi:hypothetical protein
MITSSCDHHHRLRLHLGVEFVALKEKTFSFIVVISRICGASLSRNERFFVFAMGPLPEGSSHDFSYGVLPPKGDMRMNPIAVLRRRVPMSPLLGLLLLLCVSTHPAIGQQVQSQPHAPVQLKPVSLPHLYWHFLIHQSRLDAFAAKLTAEGHDGQALRNDLQTRLGFSDTEYAPIRTASQQLATELQPIEAQLKALQGSTSDPARVQALIAQREADINNVVYDLSIELSPQNKVTLERFMKNFFAPKTVSTAVVRTSISTGKAAQQ